MSEKEKRLFNEVFLQFYPILYGYGKRIISDDYLIEESIQELFLYIYQKKIDLANIKNLNAYLLPSFRRKILLRKKLEQNTLIATDILFKDGDFVTSNGKSQQNKKLIEMLNELPWRQREAIYLKYFNNLSGKEIAEIMGIQTQVVANMVYKALKKLRKSSDKLLFLGTLLIQSSF